MTSDVGVCDRYSSAHGESIDVVCATAVAATLANVAMVQSPAQY